MREEYGLRFTESIEEEKALNECIFIKNTSSRNDATAVLISNGQRKELGDISAYYLLMENKDGCLEKKVAELGGERAENLPIVISMESHRRFF